MSLLRRRRAPEPVLSIVVPVYAVEDYLDACLNSLRQQRLDAVEIVVVDDGSPDASARIARRHARQDPRVRVVTRPNGGLSAARNTGVEHARAPYLTFVDSDDVVRPEGLARAVGALERSGSDYALLPYRQLKGDVPQDVPPWVAALYGRDDRTVVAARTPELLVQATAWSKVYRRRFWDDAGLRFTEGILYEDQDVTARAFVAADQVDLVPEPTYLWRVRPGSITREATERSMGAFLDAIAVSLDVLAAVPGARAARASQVLSNDVPRYLRTLARTDDPGYRDRLLAGAATLLTESGLDLAEAPAEARVVYALLRADRAADVPAFVERGGLDLAALRSDEVGGEPALRFPFTGDQDVPDAARVLSRRQTPLDARVLRVRLDGGGIELQLLAYLRHVDGPPTAARAWWVDESGEPVAELAVVRTPEVVGHRLRTTRRGNEEAVWRVTGALPPRGPVVHLLLEVEHHGRTGRSVVELVDRSGSGAVPQHTRGWRWTGVGPFAVDRGPVPPWPVPARGVADEVDGDQVRVDGTWTDLPDAEGRHVVAEGVALALALVLPVDLDRGHLGLDAERRLVWTRLPDVPRERLTVWHARDGAVGDGPDAAGGERPGP